LGDPVSQQPKQDEEGRKNMEEQDYPSMEMIDFIHLLDKPQPTPEPPELVKLQSLDVVGA